MNLCENLAQSLANFYVIFASDQLHFSDNLH